MLYPTVDRFRGLEVSNELNYASFHLGFQKAFRHADDPAAAYEQLRQNLIQFFLIHGHGTDADDLADAVIDRLLKRVCDDSVQIEDDKGVFRFALGVARYVNLEQLRRKHRKQSVLSAGSYLGTLHPDDTFEAERYSKALESCLKQLRPNERKLLTEYYGVRQGETKRLALELGISHGKLRVQIHRLRKRLRQMMDQHLNY
jgi:RNA polymerase sigma factor (sigma-70 family)